MAIISDRPHVLVIPYPAQGHVMPVMRFSYCLVDRGFMVTFVTTEYIHSRLLMNPFLENRNEVGHLNLVSIPDGLTPEERKDPNKQDTAIRNYLPAELEKLIRRVNESGETHGKIKCVIADEFVRWALDVARDMGLRQASFFPASPGLKALVHHIPKLIEMGAIDENGIPLKDDTIIWSPTMPGIKTADLMWNCLDGFISSTTVFRDLVENNQRSKSVEWVLCNSFEELDHAALELVPNLLPIGPLLANNQLGSLWSEDLSCLSWLDQQPSSSVIYVAFGSIAVLDQHQFEELALALEDVGRPFLWVVRSGPESDDLYGRPSTTYPDGYLDRVAHLGKIVSWAPQQKVLSHPSVACFVSHCGWNSTIDGVSMGIPFICWPYFSDQLFNATVITNVWKVGLRLNSDKGRIISRKEIRNKLDRLLHDKEIKGKSLKLKELAIKSVKKGGSSFKNLELFMEELKH